MAAVCNGLLSDNAACDCRYHNEQDRFFQNGICLDCGHARRQHPPPLPSTAPPPAPPSAYVPMFRDSLKKGGIHRPNDDVIRVILEKYDNKLIVAASDPAGSVNLYENVANLPKSSTRNLLRESLGICICENLDPSYPNRIFKGLDGIKPIILKVAKENEIKTYQTIFGDKSKEEMAALHLVHCKPISIRNDDALRAVMQHSEHVPFNCKRFEALQMDWYTVTLRASMQRGRLDDLYTGALQIEKALNYIHSTGHVHMDVKGENILLDSNGHWFLGDFDSCVEDGEAIRSTTECYYTFLLLGLPAQYKIDWYMLVVALAVEVVKSDAAAKVNEKLLNNEFHVDNAKLTTIIEGITSSKLREFMSRYQALGYSA